MTSKGIHSYSKVYNLGHPAIDTLFKSDLVVQEKIDGSQISWRWDSDGQLHVRSKGSVQFGPERTECDGMFADAVAYLLGLKPLRTLTFRGEWLQKPKHNTIAYDRRPRNGLMLFDAEWDPYRFASRYELEMFAEDMDIELVPEYHVEAPITLDKLVAFLERESVLGGAKIEGVVLKAYDQFTKDGKVMMGKHVSEAFKEKHKREWKQGNPSRQDIVQHIIESLDTDARYHKAIQHLRDEGLLVDEPKDIGPLMKELKRDTEEEEFDWIAEKLVKHFMPQILRGVGRRFPQFYKDLLAEKQFEQ